MSKTAPTDSTNSADLALPVNRHPSPNEQGPANALNNAFPLSTNERILLESACVDVIGILEQLLEKANEERSAGYLGESALVANQMVISLVDFSEGYLDGATLAVVYDLIAAAYKTTEKTVELASSQTLGVLRRIVGRKSATDEEVAESHKAVGQAVAAAAEAALVGGLSRLDGSSSVCNELRESVAPILVELRGKW